MTRATPGRCMHFAMPVGIMSSGEPLFSEAPDEVGALGLAERAKTWSETRTFK